MRHTIPSLVQTILLPAMLVFALPAGGEPHPALRVATPADTALSNPAIDMAGYLRVAAEAATYRSARRVSEGEFIRMSREPGTIVLDARSLDKYDELHIRGARHLGFTDITASSLDAVIPNRDARVLIYCDNNFDNADGAFPRKMANASLNLSTFIALYTYGYRNIYELAPLIDIHHTRLEFESAAPGDR